MYDLIYTDTHETYKEIRDIIKNEYDAKIKDASDAIHTNRFSVEFDIEKQDWYKFILQKGFALCSLNFQMAMHQDPENIKALIEEMKKENNISVVNMRG